MDLDVRLRELGIEPVVGDRFLVMREDELQEIERKLSVRLPEAYRKLLLTYGAAAFGHGVKFRPVHPLPSYLSDTGEHDIDFFYGPANDKHEIYSLAWAIPTYWGRMPINLIPIGGDGFGNQICLGIRGAETGKVYYWNHDREWDEEVYRAQGWPTPINPMLWNVHLIADSFEDFLNRLYIYEYGE